MTRQIVCQIKDEPVEKIKISNLTYEELETYIVAYETKPHGCGDVGLGILIRLPDGYGFVYHKHLIKGLRIGATFKGKTRREAVKNALKAERKVLMFNAFREFLDHASNYAMEY